ncbi:hypothetical protein G5I_03489 [Acromyrmex echinatior]|uniref:CCHC-type domain-containing protein n=1 Tax=Acromyrmex echinatior TaxID=103372 RepID=F4WD40_ACREC|nr:hypothetical protein G5I_03489 [Acromyrmex echinatior]
MQALFGRLSPPWDLTEQLDYAHRRNMLPRLQMNLRRDEFSNFVTLELLASRLEVSHKANLTRRAPPTPEKSIFPELAYRPRKPSRSSRVDATEFSVPAIAGSRRAPSHNRAEAAARGAGALATSATTPVRTIKCWNCEKTGHIARECGEMRRPFRRFRRALTLEGRRRKIVSTVPYLGERLPGCLPVTCRWITIGKKLAAIDVRRSRDLLDPLGKEGVVTFSVRHKGRMA